MRLAAFALIAALFAPSVAAQSSPSRGRQLFESQCARCHGITGGGAMGPSLRRPVLERAPDDSTFADLLTNGIYERGMPPAWQLNRGEIADVIGYVRSLGRATAAKVVGDPTRGRSIFAGKGACGTCHMVNGVGGAFGPDLSIIGAARGPEYLTESLMKPGAALPVGAQTNYVAAQFARYLPIHAVTASGHDIVGVRVNEDRFTIQVRTLSGALLSLDKKDLRVLEKRFGTSLMPSYAAVLSTAEIDDVVAYLVSLRGSR
jgi:putative heme-binding domain-containing protein